MAKDKNDQTLEEQVEPGATVVRSVATDPAFAAEKQAERDAEVKLDINDTKHANMTYEEIQASKEA